MRIFERVLARVGAAVAALKDAPLAPVKRTRVYSTVYDYRNSAGWS